MVTGYFLRDAASVFSLAPSVAAVWVFLLLHNTTHSGRWLNCGSSVSQIETGGRLGGSAGVQWRGRPSVCQGGACQLCAHLGAWTQQLALRNEPAPPASLLPLSVLPICSLEFLASGDVSLVERPPPPDLARREGSEGNTSKP